jgi:hypothetical protein
MAVSLELPRQEHQELFKDATVVHLCPEQSGVEFPIVRRDDGGRYQQQRNRIEIGRFSRPATTLRYSRLDPS